MNHTGTLLLLFVLAGLSACVNVPPGAPAYSRAPAPLAGESNLYIYRNGAFPKARAPRVSVDGKRVFEPPEGAYTVLTLPPGEHNVEMTWALDLKQPQRNVLVTLGDQDEQFLKITGDFDYQPSSFEQELILEMTGDIFSFPHTFNWLVAIPPDTAEKEMHGCCRYLAPKN